MWYALEVSFKIMSEAAARPRIGWSLLLTWVPMFTVCHMYLLVTRLQLRSTRLKVSRSLLSSWDIISQSTSKGKGWRNGKIVIVYTQGKVGVRHGVSLGTQDRSTHIHLNIGSKETREAGWTDDDGPILWRVWSWREWNCTGARWPVASGYIGQ